MTYNTNRNQQLLAILQHPAFGHLANDSQHALLIKRLENWTISDQHGDNAQPHINLENIISTIPELDAQPQADPLSVVIPITIFYAFIFVAGILGNVMTCVIIFKNKHMHTATNYYLFNLAVSDFLLLVLGLPLDLYNIWYPNSFPFNETTCIFQGLLLETVTNVTILTITSFSVERYIAICHPFRSHAMSKLSRAIKFIVGIWIGAFSLATPQSFLFGILDENGSRVCTIKTSIVNGYFFEISSFLFFIGPLLVISILYIRIGLKLKNNSIFEGCAPQETERTRTSVRAQTRVVRMLIAVVVAFMLCWFPFHAQRLMAVYGKSMSIDTPFEPHQLFMRIYVILTYISGVMYFLSTCINPLLYNIMSKKFRAASKKTLQPYCNKCFCCTQQPKHHYTGISIHQSMFRTKKEPRPKPRRLTIPFVKQDSSSSMTTQLTFNLATPVDQFSNQLTPPLNTFLSRNPPNFFPPPTPQSPSKAKSASISESVDAKDELRTKFELVKRDTSLRESEEDRYL
ncbi:pyrokinin-1 receptor-like [Culicoides brevitarsis]|uniref:pyrokinin-1 receptor-like n=1 Tax=Culicoides brevitarsis TaxID=469753 RepID=UPI00307C4EF4